MDFGEVIENCRTVAQQIRAKLNTIDGLVGVSRGGWVPTRILSSLVSVKRIYSIGLQYADAARTELVCYDDPLQFFGPDSTLIVIEDCLETGNALRFAKAHLNSKGHNVYTAALFITAKSVFIPDFYVARLESAPSFPWEVSK